MTKGYSELANQLVRAANGVDYAYRDTGGGEGAVPLVLLQHFRGNLDSWDPALIDALARTRRVVTFDNTGVGGFLFQHHAEFAADIEVFLGVPGS
jgi:pimeloyl-ACP methyl ester carboxylesterase